MSEADDLAAKYGIGVMASPAPAGNDADALAAKYGIEAPRSDMGHESHRTSRSSMPEPKTDEELGIDSGPLYGNILGHPRSSQAARDAPGTSVYGAYHAGDEMNDPGAQMITAGAMAAPLAAIAGAAAPAALAPMVSGAVSGGQQAAMLGQNPLLGAALGAIPGVPGAARAADLAIGKKALDIATRPGVSAVPGKVAKFVGGTVGAGVGHAVGGPVGAAAGAYIGSKAPMVLANAGDKMINSLAERYLNRTAAGISIPPTTLAPLVHQPLPEPTSVPGGAFGTPFLDEISGEPVTQAGKGGFLPEEAPTNAGGKSPMVSNLKADVIRDAKSYREGPAEPSGNPAANVEEQLGKTIKILDDLKAAKAAGTLTPKMTKAAVNAGISPKLVYRVTGDESIKGLPFSVKVIGRMKNGEPLTKAVSGASGEEE